MQVILFKFLLYREILKLCLNETFGWECTCDTFLNFFTSPMISFFTFTFVVNKTLTLLFDYPTIDEKKLWQQIKMIEKNKS